MLSRVHIRGDWRKRRFSNTMTSEAYVTIQRAHARACSIIGILVTRALDRPKALGNSMQENMRRRVLIAKNRLLEPYGACSLLVLAWMHQLKTLLIVLHENQWEDTLFQGSPGLFSRSVKRRALGSRLDNWRLAFSRIRVDGQIRFLNTSCFFPFAENKAHFRNNPDTYRWGLTDGLRISGHI